jgi:hypothetical protein
MAKCVSLTIFVEFVHYRSQNTIVVQLTSISHVQIDQLLCFVTSNSTNHGIDWKVCCHSFTLVTHSTNMPGRIGVEKKSVRSYLIELANNCKRCSISIGIADSQWNDDRPTT